VRRAALAGAALLLLAAGILWLGALRGRGSRPSPPPSLPPLSPRGELRDGIEVFAPGFRAQGDVVALCSDVHFAVGRVLRGKSEPRGLRLHMFSKPAEATAYVKSALGRHQRGTSYIRLNDERLVVLEPSSTWPLLQHEISHDATCEILGERVPGYFAEGLAVNLEAWRIDAGCVRQRPNASWATRFEQLRARGELPSQASLAAASRFSGEAAYARSWGTFAALLFLARWTREVSLDDIPPGPALDDLARVLGAHWGEGPARTQGLLSRAREAEGGKRAILLALAEDSAGRWLDPTKGGLADPVVAEAVRDLGSASSAWKATLQLAVTRAEPRDLRALSVQAQGRSWTRLAYVAATLAESLEPNPTTQGVVAAGHVRGRLECEVATRGGRVSLASKTWDLVPLRGLATRCGRALDLAAELGFPLPALELRVEAPGPGKADLRGWPEEPELLRQLGGRIWSRLPKHPRLRWESVGLREALAWKLDPARGIRCRARLRGAEAAFPSFDWRAEARKFDPLLRAAAALKVVGGTWDLEAAPSLEEWLAWDLGAARAQEVDLSGPDRLYVLLRGLLLGSKDPQTLPQFLEELQAQGFGAAAGCLRERASR